MSQGLPFYSYEWIWFHTPQVPCPAKYLATTQRILLVCLSLVARVMLLWQCMYVCMRVCCCRLQVGSSICDEEVSGWLGPHGAVQAAARWSIIYYRTSLLLLCVTNALHWDGLPEVNAAGLTPVPSDKHCQCLIRKSSSSAKYPVSLLWSWLKAFISSNDVTLVLFA